MGERVVKFSDLSGKIVEGDQLVRIVVHTHPDLVDDSVEIEAAPEELDDIDENELTVVRFDVFAPGEDPRTVIMEVAAFNKLATDGAMADILAAAKKATSARPAMTAPRQEAKERLNYATLELAGTPHRGKTTEDEARIVRENLDAVNERLTKSGHRTIDPADPKMAERYGFVVEDPSES